MLDINIDLWENVKQTNNMFNNTEPVELKVLER